MTPASMSNSVFDIDAEFKFPHLQVPRKKLAGGRLDGWLAI